MKKERCSATTMLRQNVPLVCAPPPSWKGPDVYSDDTQAGFFKIATCELLKGHKSRHSSSKVTDFFKSIEW